MLLLALLLLPFFEANEVAFFYSPTFRVSIKITAALTKDIPPR